MNKWVWTLLNLSLAGLLGLLVLLLIAMHTNPNKRNPYWLQGMVDTPAPADFSQNPYFADGQTLQTPPDGTLAQGQDPYPYGGGVEEAIKAGNALKSPLNPDDAQVLERGKILFERNCMPCHGVAGRGDGVVPKHGFPPPPSLLAAHAKGLPDGYIYNYISRGGMLMPSYGAQIAPQERWKVVAWVRHMQKTFPENAPADGTPQAVYEAALIPSTTPGYGYDGPPPVDEVEADEALTQAEIVNRGEPSPAEAVEVAAVSSASSGPAPTDPWGKAQYLIKKNGYDCFTCHAVDHKVIGPAYLDVAKRYAGVAGIVPKLVAKVKAGGAGNWGAVPMVAHPNISDADLTTLVEGVLSLSKKKGGPQSMAPRAPSMKQVLALVHSGAPIHCPALGDQAINGPAFLDAARQQGQDGDDASGAVVRRVSADEMAALDSALGADAASAGKEMK